MRKKSKLGRNIALGALAVVVGSQGVKHATSSLENTSTVENTDSADNKLLRQEIEIEHFSHLIDMATEALESFPNQAELAHISKEDMKYIQDGVAELDFIVFEPKMRAEVDDLKARLDELEKLRDFMLRIAHTDQALYAQVEKLLPSADADPDTNSDAVIWEYETGRMNRRIDFYHQALQKYPTAEQLESFMQTITFMQFELEEMIPLATTPALEAELINLAERTARLIAFGHVLTEFYQDPVYYQRVQHGSPEDTFMLMQIVLEKVDAAISLRRAELDSLDSIE